MKKLMIAAAVAALAGVTFAGNAFEYKASVKYTNLKKTTIKVDGDSATGYIKVLKTASITGYLITNPDCPCTIAAALPNNGMLVVQNKAVKSGVKLLPANLLVQVCQTAKSKFLAEGYLFAGKGNIAPVTQQQAQAQDFGNVNTRMTKKLFGAYNTPSGNQFVDAWLDAAGFGAAKKGADEEEGCDIEHGALCLVNLAGSVIGGCFMCHPADLWARFAYGEIFLCQNWAATTSVVSGTWSIKETSKVKEDNGTLTQTEIDIPVVNGKFERLVKAAAKLMDKDWTYKTPGADLTAGQFNTLFLANADPQG